MTETRSAPILSSISFTDDCSADIRLILEQSRRSAYRNINNIIVQTYWMIGYRIVVQEQQGKERADYGSRLIENLSKELSPTFGGGVSVAQLWNFRQFYNTFPNVEILNTLCRELSLSHILLPDDNPTIGLILCAEKDEIVARYSLLSESKQIYASKYFTVLPSEEELADELTRNRLYLNDR